MNGIASSGRLRGDEAHQDDGRDEAAAIPPEERGSAIAVTTSDTTTMTTKLRAAAAGSTRATVYACSSQARPSSRGYQPKRVIAPNRRPSGCVTWSPALDA